MAIISTGDEIVDIRKTPTFGQIRNSNAHMLWAQCQSAGVKADVEPIVMDDPEKIREAIRCVRNMDLVLLSGGVSMGECDFVHRVLVEEGVEILFHKVAIKPGKPVMVGLDGEKMIFGLPGNPVSAFVTFVLFVKPALQQWCGACSESFQKIKVCKRLGFGSGDKSCNRKCEINQHYVPVQDGGTFPENNLSPAHPSWAARVAYTWFR